MRKLINKYSKEKMEKNIEISYDKIEDIFYLGKKGKVKFSIDLALPLGDVVLDIGFDGAIKGIEIFNASKFFSLKSKELEKIKIADFSMVYSPAYTALNIKIKSKSETIRNNIVVPYNKKLINKN